MNVRVMETDKQTDDVRREKLSLEREGKISLTAWRFTPLKPSGEITIYLHEEGKEIDGKAREAIDQLLQDGHMVLAVDLSGIGETEPNDSEGKRRTHWSRALFGPDAESFWIAYLLGKSLIGIRTEEILAIARTFGDERHQPQIISVGRVGLPALHAFVLEPQIFSSLTVERSLAAWSDVVTAPLGYAHLSETVHGVLREYDLPDLMELTMSERIKIVDPVQPH